MHVESGGGWAMANHLRTELVLAALEMAIGQRKPVDVIHHSDQGVASLQGSGHAKHGWKAGGGSQYTALAFGGRCREAGVRPSMGSVGDAYDNAMCESFFATLECELLARQQFMTQRMARPVCKWAFDDLISLRQRIRPRSMLPAKMEIRASWFLKPNRHRVRL
jgi:putative transposase